LFAVTTRIGVGWGSYAIFTLLAAVLCSWSVPWPSWPYCGKPHVNTWPGEHSHAVNSAPHATDVAPEMPAHFAGTRRTSSSFGFLGLERTAPRPSWPCLLAPKAQALPDSSTRTVWDLPSAPETILTSFRGPSMTVGTWRLTWSPWPSWPCSLRPHDHARPSAPIATTCAAADPPQMNAIGTFRSAETREGSRTFGYVARSWVVFVVEEEGKGWEGRAT